MENKITVNRDSISLKTKDFSFRMGRSNISCSGNINNETFNNIRAFIEDPKNGTTYGDRFDKLKDQTVLNKLIIKSEKSYKVGDVISIKIGKHDIIGTIVSESKNNFIIKQNNGQEISIQKLILL